MRKSQYLRRVAAGMAVSTWSGASRLLARGERPVEEIFKRRLKVALVKQYTYCDLYTKPGRFTPQLIFSSNHRSGPVGLMSDIEADFFIVEEAPDDECQIWRSKPPLSNRRVADERWEKQRSVAKPVDQPDWSQYDLVIALENAIPAKVTRQYPSVLWATMLEYQGMSMYRDYLKRPPVGYDLFLSQHFGPTPRSWIQGNHVIEWPYAFNRSGSVRDLFPDVKKGRKIFIENHQDLKMLNSFRAQGVEAEIGGKRTCEQHLRTLTESKIFLSPSSWRPLWGNASSEAASAECIVIANRSQHWNPFLILPECDVRKTTSIRDLVFKIIDDETYYSRLLAKQNSLLDWHCYHRPLQQLQRFAATFNLRKLRICMQSI